MKTISRNILYIRSKTLACIFQENEWNFESNYPYLIGIFSQFTDFKQIKNENLVVLKVQNFVTNAIAVKYENISDDKMQPHIDDLKKRTKSSDDVFIIADANDMVFNLDLDKLDEYSSILKNFKVISINLRCAENEIKQKIIILNKLPKQLKYKVLINRSDKFINKNLLDLIDDSFEDITIVDKYFEIKIEKSRSTSDKKETCKKYIVWNKKSFKRSSVDAKQLAKMIKEVYKSVKK